MRSKWLFLIGVAAFLGLGCFKNQVGPEPEVPIDSRLRLTSHERLPDRALVIDARTAREYGCSNYRLRSSLLRIPGGYRIGFGQVVKPAICLTSIGPATTRLELGSIAPGSVVLELISNLGGVSGRIEVSPDAYHVHARSGPITFVDPELRRIPDGTVWGFFGYASPDLEPAVNEILSEMRALGTAPRSLAKGRYSVLLSNHGGDTFQVGESGEIDYGSRMGYYHVRSFAESFGGDLGALRDLVARVGRDHGDRIHLRIYTWRGDALYSWTLWREAS